MNKAFIQKDYQSKKPFSNFLSGISGELGVPIWTFYVNRGQVISSFGTRDKNGSIIEFFPANGAYLHTNISGFRTFVKIDGQVFEFFSKANETQTLEISKDKVVIHETNNDLKIKLTVSYFTLPNEKNGALVRKVNITNLGKKRNIEVIDGLPQILPAGIDYGAYKEISNLLQSWMQVEKVEDVLFYKLRATTEDTSEINQVVDGNYYFTVSDDADINYVYDYKLIFDEDTSLRNPSSFNKESLENLLTKDQISVNQVPSAFTAITSELDESLNFIALVGYSGSQEQVKSMKELFDFNYLNIKEVENEKLHNDLVDIIDTKTSKPLFDEYLKQSLLDNVLRGGIPLMYETIDGLRGYHIYSRKHGDLERDYNFFSIEPKYFSQGNGNFRDVLQNRRNDLMFVPELFDSNLIQFGSLIQADGYNPLSIEGMKFKYKGKETYGNKIDKLISKEFTPGDLATELENEGLELENNLKEIIKLSSPIIKASFGEGYWEDHFTYLDDVIDMIQYIYPDKIEDIVFNKHDYLFFDSNVYVRPRDEKYVLTNDNKIRQRDSIKHLEGKNDWLLNKSGELVKTNLIGKLITLVSNKFAHLDPFNIGLSYEANKPGWNDAMNGLPGLFGSGVSETIELLNIINRILSYTELYNDKEVLLLNSTNEFITNLNKIKYSDDLIYWDTRMNTLENYRKELLNNNNELSSIKLSHYTEFLNNVKNVLTIAIDKAKKLDNIIPTYLTYEIDEYTIIDESLNTIKPKSFKLHAIPTFLEGPTRLLKRTTSIDDSINIYNNVRNSELYDTSFKFYKTSIDLNSQASEIGRIHAFTKGWFERESNFLHMTYKYLYSVLNSNMYDKFFEEIKTNYTCFMDPEVYGRNPLENSSFIAPSNNPDVKKQGQGFVARLSGSTAEVLSMWKQMFFGKELFSYKNEELIFSPKPILHSDFFKDNRVSTTLFSTIEYEIINKDNLNTYDNKAVVSKIIILDKVGKVSTIVGSEVVGDLARSIRNRSISKVEIYISREG